MIRVLQIPLGPIETNAYMVANEETKKAIVIDPGMQPAELLFELEGYEVEAILLTHAHFDHIGGVDEVKQKYNCPIYLHPNEHDWLNDANKNGSARWPQIGAPFTTTPADISLKNGQILNLIGQSIEVRHTPGHSPGSVSFVMGDVVFCGDALFHRGIGRTDLPGGSQQQLIQAIQQKLMTLPPDTIAYPGHGRETTIGDEKKYNPYL